MPTEFQAADPEEGEEYLQDVFDSIADNIELIEDNKRVIESVFESFVNKKSYSDVDPLFHSLDAVFSSKLDDEDSQELSEYLVNFAANSRVSNIKNIREEIDEEYEDTIGFLISLNRKYQSELTGVLNHLTQGSQWWSNIDTTPRIRRETVSFEHEITIREEKRVTFHSDMGASTQLAIHFLQNISDAPSLIGGDAISDIRTEQIDRIQELADELEKMKKEYEPETISEENKSEE